MTTNEAPTTTQMAAVADPGAHVAPQKAASNKGAIQKKNAPQGRKRAEAAKPAKPKVPKKDRHSMPAGEKPLARQGTAKARVIDMLGRKGGATLEEIVKATGWQKHTIRGLVSILGSKGGMKIESTKREDGARAYTAR